MSLSSHGTTTEMTLKDIEKGSSTLHEHNSADQHESKFSHEHPTSPNTADNQNVQPLVDDWATDPDNPYNWPMWQRFYHTMTPAFLGFAVTFGTSVYTPAVSSITSDLHISRTVSLLGLTLYTLGIGFGPVITAPLSEGHGRRIVYLVSSPIFMLFTLGAGFSNHFASVAVCRFFAGVCGSPALAVGSGTNADVFEPRLRAKATSMFLVAPFAGPALGPIVGGFVAQYKGWRWTQWCLIFVTLVAFIIALPMKETYKPIILKQRAKKLGITPPAELTSVPAPKVTFTMRVGRPLHMLFTEPAVFFFSLYTSFAFGTLFMFFAAFPYIFSHPPYSFTVSQSGLTFLSLGVGVLLGAATTLLVDTYMYQPQHIKALENGQLGAAPEYRLYTAMIGGVGIVIGLFWAGWALGTGTHWSVGLVGVIPFAWGNMCLFNSAVLYLADTYGALNGASAMAANGVSRYTFGAVFPLFTVQMYQALGTAWATSLLGFVALVMLPIPFVFFKYGAKIREKSRYPKII